jgi:hypothetical protein
MKTARDSRKQVADRRGGYGGLFRGELDGPHAPEGEGQVAEQPRTPISADVQTRQVLDQANHEPLTGPQNLEMPVPPDGVLGQGLIRSNLAVGRYPLLEALLAQKGLPLKGIWTLRDAAMIFEAAVRTTQDWIRDGKLIARDLPGRGRFLSEDLEAFLQNSVQRVPRHDQRM